MSRVLLFIVVLVVLFSSAFAQWEPLDSINAPWYGTARCFSTVVWNDQRWIFAADGIGKLYRSSDNGTTWQSQESPEVFNDVTFILADPYTSDRDGYVYAARYNVNEEEINGFWRSTDRGRTFTRQNGDDCNNPPFQAPLGNLKIVSIRKIDRSGQATSNQFPDVIATCWLVNDGSDDNLIAYASDPTAQTMCWEQQFTGFDNCPNYPYCYDLMDFAQNYYGTVDSVESILGEGDFTYPLTNPLDYGVWRYDLNGWQRILRMSVDSLVCAGTRFFRYKNSDITTWPFYEFGSWRHSVAPWANIIPDMYRYNRGSSPLEWELLTDPAEFPRESAGLDDGNAFHFADLAFAGRDEYENDVYITVNHTYERRVSPNLAPGIYISRDEGSTWQNETNWSTPDRGVYFNSGRGIISFPGPEDSLWALYGAAQLHSPAFNYTDGWLFFGALYRSSNHGQDWKECTKYMNTLMAHEIEISHDSLVACGATIANQDSQVFATFSTDLGESWTAKFARQMEPSTAWYARDMEMSKTHPNIIAISAPFDGDAQRLDSIYVTDDWGSHWTSEYGMDLQHNDVIINGLASSGDIFYACMTGADYVVKRKPDNPAFWEAFGTWDVNYSDPLSIDVGPYDNGTILYVGTESGGVKKRVDNLTATWSAAGLSGYTDINLIRVIPSTNSSVVIAKATSGGYTKLYRTTNSGTSWQACSNGIPGTYANTQAIEPIPNEPHIILATAVNSSLQGKCFLSLNMGNTWAEYNPNLALPGIYMKDIAIWGPPPNAYGFVAYVATNNGLYRSPIPIINPTISSDTTWTSDNPIFVTQDVTVNSGVTLTVEPGTKIYFAPDFDNGHSGTDANRCELIVDGTLSADASGGTAISFLPWTDDPAADSAEWYGIKGASGSYITMNNCTVERAIYGVKGTGAYLNIRHCNFNYIANTGIYSASTPLYAVIDTNDFQFCYSYGVNIAEGAGHSIIGNGLSKCENGIRYSSSSGSFIALNIKNNDIENSSASTGDGIHIQLGGAYTLNLMDNTVSGYSTGIYISNATAGTLTGNYSHDNSYYGLYLVNVGANFICTAGTHNAFNSNDIGISCNGTTTSTFRYNKAKDNSTYGVYVASSSSSDFGTTASYGNNNFYNSSAKYDLYRAGAYYIYAQECYWGGGKGNMSGNVYGTPYLSTDPVPGNPKRDGNELPIPKTAVIAQNYPNPFNPTTTITFSLPHGANIKAEVFNIMGQKVQTISEGYFSSGVHSLIWNGRNAYGIEQASGIYLFRLSGEDINFSSKMTLLR